MGAARIRPFGAIFCTSIAAITVISVPAFAAEIEEIVVTAKKRDQRLQDTPLAVSALPAKSLEKAGVRGVFDLAELVPSLGVTESTGPLSTSYFIRRIGNLGSIPDFESAVGLFVDGTFRSRNGASLDDLFDIHQVEVIRGPQTTLHGKNTTAGVVSISTNRPTPEFLLQGKVTMGRIESYDTASSRRLEAVVNGAMSSSISGRASILYTEHDDTLSNLFNGIHSQNADRYTVRGQLHYANETGLDTRLIVSRYHVDSARSGDMALFEGNAISGINSAFGVPCPDHDVDERLFCRNRASVFDLTSDNVTLNLDIPVADVAISSVTSFEDYESNRAFDADQLNIDVVNILDQQDGQNWSQELRLHGPEHASVVWLAGAFYFDSSFDRGSDGQPTAVLGPAAPMIELVPGLPLGEPGDSGFFVSNSDTRHLSLFTNADWLPESKFSITSGVRWQVEDKQSTITNFADHSRPTAITQQLMPEAANASLSRDTDGWSWELAGRYRLTRPAMVYVVVSQGFKSGGFNGGFGAIPPDDREFDDETVRSYEFGYKSILMQDRLRFNAALFKTRYEDFHSAGWVGLRFLVNNAEQVDVSGAELDLEAALSDRFSITASVSYVDASYDRYTNGSCSFDKFPDNADGSACDLSGQPLPFAPKTRSHLDLSYEYPIRSGALFSRLDWTWSSDYYTNTSLDSRHVQAAHSLINLRLGFRTDRFEVVGWVRNAADELVVLQEGPSNLFPRDPAYGRFFALPRSYGVTVSARL